MIPAKSELRRMSLSEEVRNAAILTNYSVEARYPGPFEPATEEEFTNALKIAEAATVFDDPLSVTVSDPEHSALIGNILLHTY